MNPYTPLSMNYQLSQTVCDRNRQHLEMKGCYNNVFNISISDSTVLAKTKAGKWKIAIGYFNSEENPSTYIRHAFFVETKTNQVIDPTLSLVDEVFGRDLKDRETHYYVLASYSLHDYLLNVKENDDFPSLEKVLKTEEETFWQWLTTQNCTWEGYFWG